MLQRLRMTHDPFWDDGQGARRGHAHRFRVGLLALVIAIVACGLTTAAWIRVVFATTLGGTPLG